MTGTQAINFVIRRERAVFKLFSFAVMHDAALRTVEDLLGSYSSMEDAISAARADHGARSHEIRVIC